MQSSRGCATPTIFRTRGFCWQRSLRKIGGATRSWASLALGDVFRWE